MADLIIRGMEMPRYTTKAEFGIDADGNPLCMVYHEDGTDPDIYDVVPLPEGHEMTNANKIRAMTDDELAALFTKVMAGNSGVQLDGIWQEKGTEENQRYFTRLNWLDWLKQEASNGN